MPQLGETVAEGKITKWFKAAGDAVKPGDNLFEIETDKTSMEVPSTTTGTLSRNSVQRGRGRQGRGCGGGDYQAPALRKVRRRHPRQPKRRRLQSRPAPVAAEAVAQVGAGPAHRADGSFREVRTPERNYGPGRLAGGTAVTPLARRLAGERGIDLSRVSGSGPHGRIVARDVERAAPGSAMSGNREVESAPRR